MPQTTFRHALSRTSEADGTVVHARIHAHSMIGRSYSTGTVLHCSVLGMGRLHTASPPPPRKHAFRARERKRDAVCAFAKPTDGRSHTAYHERRCESGCAPSVILRDAEAARSVRVQRSSRDPLNACLSSAVVPSMRSAHSKHAS